MSQKVIDVYFTSTFDLQFTTIKNFGGLHKPPGTYNLLGSLSVLRPAQQLLIGEWRPNHVGRREGANLSQAQVMCWGITVDTKAPRRGKKKKKQAGKHSTRKIGKEPPKHSNELDLLSEICQTLYHTRSILSGNCNIVELQTLWHRRSLSNKQLPYAMTACLSFILIYLPKSLLFLPPLKEPIWSVI